MKNQNQSSRKIFVLGDSRTGTMSLHAYFKRHGISSIHYYVEEANQKEPIHLYHNENWIEVEKFLDSCEYTAFSDYPTRSFYREIYEKFPDSFFILTVRKSIEVWKNSVLKFFGKFFSDFDIENMIVSYETLNQEIRNLYGDSKRNFLEVCIDDDISVNSKKLSQFLGLDPEIKLSHENKTNAYSNEILSGRRTIYGSIEGDPIDYVEKICYPSKAMQSESGWLYLVNDSNNFLRVQYGSPTWSNEEKLNVLSIIHERIASLGKMNIHYAKFAIPEKSIIYSEHLPKIFSNMETAVDRPASFIAEKHPKNIFYLENYLRDAKSYGILYFRGDTHTNWLGSFFIYRFIAEYLAANNFIDSWKSIFSYNDFLPSIAQYDGDLYGQLDSEQNNILKSVWGHLLGKYGLECLVKYELDNKHKQAVRVEVPKQYKEWFSSRETIVYECNNQELPRAVIFRDSTADFIHEPLAQHFSRSVFVWYKGQVISNVIEAECPDIVLHIMAERFITKYPTWKALYKMPS